MRKEAPDNAKNRKKTVIIAVIALLLVVIGVLLFLLLRPKDDQIVTLGSRDPNAAIGQIEGKTPEEIQAELDKIVEQGMFNVSINPAISFANGESEGDVRIENVPGNYYLMSATITLDDTGKTLYKSGVIEPNYHIQTAKLAVPLKKGQYAATATFTAYDPETEDIAGHAAVKITINVLA